MQYNKNKFNKIKDKKVLHKVKKQWITISLSMFAMLGAAGVAIYDPTYAHADTTDNTNNKINTTQEEHGSNENTSSSVHQNQSQDNFQKLSQSDSNKQKENNTPVNGEQNNIQKPKNDVHTNDNQQPQVQKHYQVNQLSQNNNQHNQQAGHTSEFQSVNSRMVTQP